MGMGFVLYSFLLVKVYKARFHINPNSSGEYLSDKDKVLLKRTTFILIVGVILFIIGAIW